MGQPPALLFVVRHGLRLDAADKQWHLSSPAPYDPPLTYSGWQQAKSLGARIASIIRDKAKEDEAAERQAPNSSGKRKRKRYKIAVHSSPFLRCIQTSVAISAGLAQDSTPFGSTDPDDTVSNIDSTSAMSPRTRPSIVTDVSALARAPVPIRRSVLRLDAFLGEWLSPSYYELITPPPESVMMLASAKADLLKREDYSSYANFSHHVYSNSQGSQGQLWSPIGRSSPAPSSAGDEPEGSLSRSGSTSSQNDPSRRSSVAVSEANGYVAPVPHYAVSNNNTIPPGYVAHARDACVDIDYQWDSMRSPWDWGDGGSFPEEWTSMHRRFRKGIQGLVDWYSTAENPTEMVTKMVARNGRKASVASASSEFALEDDDDVETESIVILVSHGAGCNAMIGAITHQPVLMDVGMASLTMAVRKPLGDDSDASRRASNSSERGGETLPIHQQYELKLFANTDHLRTPAPTPSSSRSPSIAGLVNGSRGRYSNSFSSSLNNFSFNDASGSRASSANAALSSLRNGGSPASPRIPFMSNSARNGGGITVGSGVTSFQTRGFSLTRTPSIGLWSPTSAQDDDDDDDDGMVLNFSHEKHTASASTAKATDANASGFETNASTALSNIHLSGVPSPESTEQVKTPMPTGDSGTEMSTPRAMDPRGEYFPSSEQQKSLDITPDGTGGANGLWGGGPRPPDEADALRDLSSPKRRWSVTEPS
ncbi:hypothetical protein B0H66DRAFT_575436 [Apodospora peruviana]|uniref:Phosphoglycerate mutase n=1 Tax=Apodospora peruviana TaxID=516989 RepID=A0AAE0M4U7_9PEZI|nr:hypothetical protein B0H66DRAFT_575436 [Apodospora peruviana]